VKAGGGPHNHNGIRIKTRTRAGIVTINHNATRA